MKQTRGWHHPPSALGGRNGIRSSLIASVLGPDQATPRVERKVKKRGAPEVKGDDALILEIRRLSEQCGMKPAAIKNHLAKLGHNVDRERIRCVADYTTRAHLIPTLGAEPYIKENP